MTEIPMPQLSDSMQEGTIVKWLVADGQPVVRGQELVEIETDKATITHSADADGTLEILAPEGTTLAVGEPIARVGAAVAASPPAAPPAAAPAPAPALATPLAQRVARIHDVELTDVAGTGPRGRITRADVLSAAGVEIGRPSRPPVRASRADAQSSGSAESNPGALESVALESVAPALAPSGNGSIEGAKGETQRLRTSRLQQTVARRMAEAKATIPHFQVQIEARMDAAIALRAQLKTCVDGESVPSLNDLIVKACALALRRHPRANGSYVDGEFELHGRVNIGVAVASEDALVVAVLKDADTKSLGSIARESRRLAERVRSGEISPPELSGATFTVSNLGMFGMSAITPVINPPQAAILGVGGLRETLARVGGEIVDRTLMTLTLSCDHRILYGADAAWLLADVGELLQTPLALAL
jgi:pyruvate dehydrogenase E2 component (dihydrolipoamide acetyltransferase)